MFLVFINFFKSLFFCVFYNSVGGSFPCICNFLFQKLLHDFCFVNFHNAVITRFNIHFHILVFSAINTFIIIAEIKHLYQHSSQAGEIVVKCLRSRTQQHSHFKIRTNDHFHSKQHYNLTNDNANIFLIKNLHQMENF